MDPMTRVISVRCLETVFRIKRYINPDFYYIHGISIKLSLLNKFTKKNRALIIYLSLSIIEF